MKPTCSICGGLGWVDSYGHVRHDAPGAYDHLFKRREKAKPAEPEKPIDPTDHWVIEYEDGIPVRDEVERMTFLSPSLEEMEPWEGLNPPYRTIVADPPWPMPETGRRTIPPGGGSWQPYAGSTSALPYTTLSLSEIAALPIGVLTGRDAHLYLWTTNRFLEESFDILRGWGFRKGAVLTWCKPPMGLGFGGAFANTTEFVVAGRRGVLANTSRVDSSWWQWSRGPHSAKPAGFLDIVERVSPGPYVELFARQPRMGWDSWGWGYEGTTR